MPRQHNNLCLYSYCNGFNMNAATYSNMLAGGNSLGNLVRACAKLMAQRAERIFEDPELNLTHRFALMLIELGVAKTSGELADSLGHNAGAMTRTVDQLKRQGLLKRRREIKDHRVVTLTLTPQGSSKAWESQRTLAELNRRILKDSEVVEVQALIMLLNRLMMALGSRNSL